MSNLTVNKNETQCNDECRSNCAGTPSADVWESQAGYQLEIEVPGAASDDIDVSLDDQVLTVVAKVQSAVNDGFTPVYTEYRTEDLRRRFRLPDDVNDDGIEASVRNGVLRVSVPKREAAQPKKIAIKSG